MTTWRSLNRFERQDIGKVFWLRQAQRRGLAVPETMWMPRDEALLGEGLRPEAKPWQLGIVVRSGSPSEDQAGKSNAGKFHSELVTSSDPAEFKAAVRRVAESLDDGVVFIQPEIKGPRAGIAFFDAWWWERSEAPEHNRDLTSGQARGDVVRGHRQRKDPWSEWLDQIIKVCPKFARWDVEYVVLPEAPDRKPQWMLLQVRPASFELTKNPILSLANHREILGDPPSPWIASVLIESGADAFGFFAGADSGLKQWTEPYAVPLAGRAWMNFSVFFRMMDRWGLPRTFVTDGVGGEGAGPHDGRPMIGRMLRHSPKLLRLQWRSLTTVWARKRALRDLDTQIAACKTIEDYFNANVAGLALALRTNFAINGILSGVSRARSFLRIRGGVEVETERMMLGFDRIASLSSESKGEALDQWLADFGHRGPLESDPARPRFAELRDVLLSDLESRKAGAGKEASSRAWWPLRWLFWIDKVREDFRSRLMERWVPMRQGLLGLTQHWDNPEALWRMTREDLQSSDLEAQAKTAFARPTPPSLSGISLTADQETLDAELLAAQEASGDHAADTRTRWPGIPLSSQSVTGVVLKADDVVHLLSHTDRITNKTILVVPALEPSWAVFFPRVLGVVAEIGGELSHASILLREAKIPAIVNCRGIFNALSDGDAITLSPEQRSVLRVQ